MGESKVGIDFAKVAEARKASEAIANEVQEFVDAHTTVTVERTLCRFLGIDGIDNNGVPLPNVLVNFLIENGMLSNGVLFYIANAMKATGLTPQQIAEGVDDGKIDLRSFPALSERNIESVLKPYIDEGMNHILTRRRRRENFIKNVGEGAQPYL